jgi:hypothetical protein
VSKHTSPRGKRLERERVSEMQQKDFQSWERMRENEDRRMTKSFFSSFANTSYERTQQ